eukprot:Selendium_serpulae@DN5222_c0_g1_i1.p1
MPLRLRCPRAALVCVVAGLLSCSVRAAPSPDAVLHADVAVRPEAEVSTAQFCWESAPPSAVSHLADTADGAHLPVCDVTKTLTGARLSHWRVETAPRENLAISWSRAKQRHSSPFDDGDRAAPVRDDLVDDGDALAKVWFFDAPVAAEEVQRSVQEAPARELKLFGNRLVDAKNLQCTDEEPLCKSFKKNWEGYLQSVVDTRRKQKEVDESRGRFGASAEEGLKHAMEHEAVARRGGGR